MQTSNLNTLTVIEIKEWAKINNLKIPSGLKKAELIQYLQGVVTEKSMGKFKENTSIISVLDVLQPRYQHETVDWLIHLHSNGWAVVPIPNWNPEFTQMFLQWSESCNSNFNSNDRNTWKSANMPIMSYGILKHYFGHTELQWQIRELCAPIFSRIWNCPQEDLLCSFDGGCFLPSIPKDNLENSSFKQWIHNDSPRSYRNFSCVQGIVNFEDNGPEDGGLVLVEGSHNIFNDYMDQHPSEGIAWGSADMNDPLLSSRNLIKICAPAGSIILFDSRLFHCNVHPWGSIFKENGTSRFRMCTYVCMQPRIGAHPKELTKRISLYEKGRMTGHWCYGSKKHPKKLIPMVKLIINQVLLK